VAPLLDRQAAEMPPRITAARPRTDVWRGDDHSKLPSSTSGVSCPVLGPVALQAKPVVPAHGSPHRFVRTGVHPYLSL